MPTGDPDPILEAQLRLGIIGRYQGFSIPGAPVPHPKTRAATPDDLDTAAMLGQRLKLSRGLLNPTGLREPGKEDARYWFANHHPIVEPYTWQDILWLQLDASTLMD